MSDLPVFSQKSMSSPGMKVGGRSEVAVGLRVYGGSALLSPGAEYKSILAREDTTASEVIAQVLERYGEPSDPSEFELRSILVDEKTGKVKRQGSLSKIFGSRTEHTITLEPDVCPVLFADWYGEENRRFELHRKPVHPTLNESGHGSGTANANGSGSPVRRQGSSLFRSFRRRTRTSAPSFNAHRELMTSTRRGRSEAALTATNASAKANSTSFSGNSGNGHTGTRSVPGSSSGSTVSFNHHTLPGHGHSEGVATFSSSSSSTTAGGTRDKLLAPLPSIDASEAEAMMAMMGSDAGSSTVADVGDMADMGSVASSSGGGGVFSPGSSAVGGVGGGGGFYTSARSDVGGVGGRVRGRGHGGGNGVARSPRRVPHSRYESTV
ncbi:hypothetical protein PTSG_08791 [Salpingoeca rosetta]|uniref:Ras-associating domain-containing protein n=1 Tax=Salpingoeca rosetta (strain ATCC 50818 / BSB-021) TaxID=946362 RepID=F2UKQ0_SALR5|nr:uncharacterized protein PTSG_08791 [Salpingoeca rosetta]EGD77699.1 hypothetical protein PTSG_08791 [Salpingoeca rosetta]|eukprot:XP_004990175.1 hypothetical protein PTSG_08791 [Salpingoeca rosetta]